MKGLTAKYSMPQPQSNFKTVDVRHLICPASSTTHYGDMQSMSRSTVADYQALMETLFDFNRVRALFCVGHHHAV
jgi:hypothetical protein